ncbi:MAG TPA: hypothetical protein VJ872_12540 [Nocardioides sp.]|nr:hypothetical protein [Nocardioides sp.]
MIPALPATYAARFATPLTPACDAVLTIAFGRSSPVASIASIWCFMPRKVPRTLVAIPRSKSATSMSASGAGLGPSVALLKARSSPPKVSTAAPTRSRTDASSVTSARSPIARPPSAAISSAIRPTAAPSRAPSTTAAPARAKARAVASPMPLLAPATRATDPEKSLSMTLTLDI